MDKLSLFIAGCKAERWKWRSWRISLFAVTQLPENHIPEQYDIDYRADGIYYWDSDWVYLQANENLPLYRPKEKAEFPAGSIDLPNTPTTTTYGRMLFNWLVVRYAFGTKLPFQHNVKPDDIVSQFINNVRDEDYTPAKADELYFKPSNVSKFVKALFELPSLCMYITPTGTERSYTTDPNLAKVRKDKLEKAHADGTINDRTKITQIVNELIDIDKAWCSEPEDRDYYISNKSFNIKRRNMYVMQGIEESFKPNGEFDLIEAPIMDGRGGTGADAEHIIASNNNTRAGGFDRGHDTALGGEKVNILERVYQTVKVVKGDCGAISMPVLITDHTAKLYRNMTGVIGGKFTQLTKEVMNNSLGKVINLRRPILCRTTPPDFCEYCTNAAYAAQPHGIAADTMDVGSTVMQGFMSAMHGNEIAVAHYDFNIHFK